MLYAAKKRVLCLRRAALLLLLEILVYMSNMDDAPNIYTHAIIVVIVIRASVRHALMREKRR